MFISIPSRGNRSNARRKLLAVTTTVFILLQSILFVFPVAAMTQQKRVRDAASVKLPIAKRAALGANVPITTLGVPVTQNFDTLATSGTTNAWTDDSTLAGWFAQFSATPTNPTTYRADSGGSNTGAIYSWGTGTATERAFGSIGSGTPGDIFWAIKLTNDTGSTITSLTVSYTGEQWRAGGCQPTPCTPLAQTADFQYQVANAAAITDANTPSTGWLDHNALDFTSPVTGTSTAAALDGNAAANRTALSSTVSVTVNPGQEVWLRWSDINHANNDHGLSVDDFSVTANGGTPTPTLNIDDVSQAEGNAGTSTFTFTVSLTSAAPLSGVTFDIATADGTAQDGNPGGEDNDYVAKSETGRTITSGNTSVSFTVTVNGDTNTEPNETFFVNVTNITGATAGDVQGQGTISNDEVTLTPIHSIQGNGDASPLDGQTVTTTGIVTLLKTGSNSGGPASGFFLQTPDANVDADPNTSQGLFVFTSSVPTVAVGDEINVTGTVDEFNGMTEISPVTNIAVIDTGNPLPTAVTLTPVILDPAALPTQPQLEKFEGMRMTAPSLTVVAPNDTFFDVETVITGVPRPMREPGIEISLTVPPDPTTGVPDCCIPRWDENPERLKVDTNARAGAPLNAYTSGVILTSVAGPLDFAFAEYRLIPDTALTASANLSAVPAPTPTANEFMVAGYNIENFNNDATQRQKAALTIRDVMRLPDIIGVIEIFDLADLQALAAEVNAIAPGAAYQAFLVEADGTSEDSDQDVGYLVDTARVQVNSVTQRNATETYINPNNGQPELLNDRPPLVLDANVEPSGANLRVIVIVNHLRSFIDIEEVAGEGPRVRAKRKAQAESLAALVQEYQTNNPTTSVISVGDYNAYQFNDGYTDPIATIKGNPTPDDQVVVDGSPDLVNPNFVNLVDGLPVTERYSFMFEGTPQALDHVLVNTVAQLLNTRFTIARVNADFPEVPAATFVSNAGRPERNSDHDPAIAYFSLGAQPVGSVLISEFRLRGPGPVGTSPEPNGTISQAATDEFVEIYNNTNSAIVVSTTDGSSGWSLVASDGVARFTIPNGTVIPARGHFLGVNSLGYSLAGYPAGNGTFATGDISYTNDIPDNAGIALFNTSNVSNFVLANRLDAVGSASEANTLYKEGTGYPALNPSISSQQSWVRNLSSGLPKDTNANSADFVFVDTQATDAGAGAHLGAPGPENLSSPIQRNATIKASLVFPCVQSGASPNRIRDLTPVFNGSLGTLDIRRKFTNNTGAIVTRLRFRIVDITTSVAPPGTADLRAITSSDVPVASGENPCGTGALTLRGSTLEEPPGQSIGGGLNSSLSLDTVTLATPLGAGASINLRLLLGVQQGGTFRFFVNVEALP